MFVTPFFVRSAAPSLPSRMGRGCWLALCGPPVEGAVRVSAAAAANAAARVHRLMHASPDAAAAGGGRATPKVGAVSAGGTCLSCCRVGTKAFVWRHEGLRNVMRRPSHGRAKPLEGDGEGVRRQVRVGLRIGADGPVADAHCGAGERRGPCGPLPVAAAGCGDGPCASKNKSGGGPDLFEGIQMGSVV